MPKTKSEALLEAIEPLRQADFSIVRETAESVIPPTPTNRIMNQVILNLIGYFEIEKDLPDVRTIDALKREFRLGVIEADIAPAVVAAAAKVLEIVPQVEPPCLDCTLNPDNLTAPGCLGCCTPKWDLYLSRTRPKKRRRRR